MLIFLKKNQIKSKKSGFVLLYALLVASVIAIGGALLSDIIFKQITLSAVGRDSQIAYYAASAGEECVRYWNERDTFGVFGVLTDEYEPPQGDVEITCNGENISVSMVDSGDVFLFTFVLSQLPNNSCARVDLTKGVENNSLVDTVVSLGYNLGDESCGGQSLRRVERRIVRSYFN